MAVRLFKCNFARISSLELYQYMRKKIVFMVMTVLVAISADAQATQDRLRQRIDVWLDNVSCQPDWLLSRLQMYWSTHATDVYING